MKLGLLGNCQVDVYRTLLAATRARDLEVHTVEVWRHKPDQFAALAEQLLSCDVLVTQPLSDAYGALSTSTMRTKARQLVVVQNIFFQGYHPDCTYLGPMGARLKSPVGDYHSECVHAVWQSGGTVADAVAAIEHYDPSRVLAIFERSAREFEVREAGVDVKIGSHVLDPQKGHGRLFTFNHPTLELHRLYLDAILRHVGLQLTLAHCSDPLLLHTRWPIYPSARTALGLPASATAPLLFHASASLGVGALDTQGFCEASFVLYDATSLNT